MERRARELETRADSIWEELSNSQAELNALKQQRAQLTTGALALEDHADITPFRTSWVEFKNEKGINDGFTTFSSLVSDRDDFDWNGREVAVRPLQKGEGGRAYCRGADIHVSKYYESEGTIVHELGHWLEASDATAQKAARQFLAVRTAGEQSSPLTTIVPGSSYTRGEWAKPDEFFHAYVGKVYPMATEVISMGMEMMATNPAKLARMDPEHFDLTFHVMRNDYDNAFMRKYTR